MGSARKWGQSRTRKEQRAVFLGARDDLRLSHYISNRGDSDRANISFARIGPKLKKPVGGRDFFQAQDVAGNS